MQTLVGRAPLDDNGVGVASVLMSSKGARAPSPMRRCMPSRVATSVRIHHVRINSGRVSR